MNTSLEPPCEVRCLGQEPKVLYHHRCHSGEKREEKREKRLKEDLARAGHVSCLATKGRNWLAIETTTELEACR